MEEEWKDVRLLAQCDTSDGGKNTARPRNFNNKEINPPIRNRTAPGTVIVLSFWSSACKRCFFSSFVRFLRREFWTRIFASAARTNSLLIF